MERYPKNSNDQDKSSERNVACKYNPEQYQQSLHAYLCSGLLIANLLFWTFIANISLTIYTPLTTLSQQTMICH